MKCFFLSIFLCSFKKAKITTEGINEPALSSHKKVACTRDISYMPTINAVNRHNVFACTLLLASPNSFFAGRLDYKRLLRKGLVWFTGLTYPKIPTGWGVLINKRL